MKVNFYATLRPIVGQKTIEVDVSKGVTAIELINQVVKDYPAMKPELLDENGNFHSHMKMFVNGREVVYMEGEFDYVLKRSDKVDIFPPVGGG
ncbi:MAG: MoaD/ThiS family protein [Anaerolineales bacterium]|jgi:molybdopterin synthase sulfur carrier subunit